MEEVVGSIPTRSTRSVHHLWIVRGTMVKGFRKKEFVVTRRLRLHTRLSSICSIASKGLLQRLSAVVLKRLIQLSFETMHPTAVLFVSARGGSPSPPCTGVTWVARNFAIEPPYSCIPKFIL